MAARDLESSGVDVIRLDIGDPDFALPDHYAEAVIAAIKAGHTHYSPVQGLPNARLAISEHMRRRFGLECTPEQIVLSQGATQGLNAAQLFCCSPGDTVLLPEIYWANYIQQVALSGLRPAFYKLNSAFLPELSDLAQLSTAAHTAGSRIAAVLVNSPGNPTGAVFPASVIGELYDFAREHNAWIISDEAYCDFVFSGSWSSPLEIDSMLEPAQRRVLGVFSGSKSYAATGLRMGWTIAPTNESATRLGLLNEPLTGSLNTPVQYGLAAAVAVEDTAERCRALIARRDLAARLLHEAGLCEAPVAGGLFYFPDVSRSGLSADEFAARLLVEQHVAVVPGSGFGLRPDPADPAVFTASAFAAKHVRLCFAVDEARLQSGVERLCRFYLSLLNR